MELEVTWSRVVKIWWAFAWRNIVAIAAGVIGGAILGMILGFIFLKLGVPAETTKTIVMILGVVLGLVISIIPIKMVLKKDFGEFKIVLKSHQL